MNEYMLGTDEGKTIGREMLVAYLNTGNSGSPTWSPIGKRVEESSIELDWGIESKNDIFNETYTTGKKPTMTQTFKPCELDAGDKAQSLIWELAIVKQDIASLTNMDMLIVHMYSTQTVGDDCFAERYSACSVTPSSLGGSGGGTLNMPIDVTYGGTRTVGSVTVSGGNVEFTPDDEE